MASIVAATSVSGAVTGVGPGVGIGWRRELAGDLLASPRLVDFVEIIAESCFTPGPQRREAVAISSIWKVIPHGIKLSLGSAEGVNLDRARQLGQLARQTRAPMVSEHATFTRGRGQEIGHLTQLPLTRTAVAVVARNLAQVRRLLPDVPFLLETPAWTLRWPEDEMDEGTFFHELVRATGCDLLLDLSNVYANALNSGCEPRALLGRYPLDRVAMVHLAGGDWRNDFYVDTHAHPTPPAAFELLAELMRTTGPVPVLLERDGNYPPFAEVRGELTRARSLVEAAAPRLRPPAPKAAPRAAEPAALRAFAERQGQLTSLLTSAEAPSAARCSPFDPVAIARSRTILHHKRAEEALALLPRLSRQGQGQGQGQGQDQGQDRDKAGGEVYGLALACIEKTRRSAALTAVADAMRIAAAAAARPALAAAALPELLQLHARFALSHGNPSPRWAPFVGSVRQADGSRIWAFKPPGRFAPVRLRTSSAKSPPHPVLGPAPENLEKAT